MDKFGKIRRHLWKERLKISKIAKFESDLFKTNEDIDPQSRQILQPFVWGVAQTPPPPPLIKTSVNFRNLRRGKSSLA